MNREFKITHKLIYLLRAPDYKFNIICSLLEKNPLFGIFKNKHISVQNTQIFYHDVRW